jgi:hypothetical protein
MSPRLATDQPNQSSLPSVPAKPLRPWLICTALLIEPLLFRNTIHTAPRLLPKSAPSPLKAPTARSGTPSPFRSPSPAADQPKPSPGASTCGKPPPFDIFT